jgi:hypothetical protein
MLALAGLGVNELLVLLDEFQRRVNAAQLEDARSHGRLKQHGDVAPRCDRNDNAADRHAEDVLRFLLDRQSRRVCLARVLALQVYDQFEPHLAPAGGLAKDRPYVEYSEAADFDEIA